MRPKKLTMIAFGPYGEEQVIDFEKLTETNIFLIHGPTGAGKTTILDAMCYALYGYTNGGERSAENMRSKFARPEQGAEVELIFKVLDKEYKVFRSPRFERPKLKGTGTTEQLPKVSLSEWDGEKFVTLSEKQMDVDKKINELLRFNIDQFRQVIMIAQNKFRELLTADSKERQKILQDIFETGLYEEMEQKLDHMNSKLAEELKVQEITYQQLLTQIDHEEDEALVPYISTKVLKNVPQVLEILETKCEIKSKDQEILAAELVGMKEKLEQLQQNLFAQTEKYNALVEQKEVVAGLLKLHDEEDKYIELKQEVEWAQKAEKLIPLEASIVELEDSIQANLQAIKALKNEMIEVGKQLEGIQGKKEVIKEKTPYIEELKRQYSIWETYLPKVEELADNKKAKEILLTQLKQQEEESKHKVSQIQSGKSYIETAQKQIEQRENLSTELNKKQLYNQQIRQVLLLKEDIKVKNKELLEARANYLEITKEITSLRQQEDELTKVYDQLFTSWLQNQAGEIAKTLEENSPCPVCGSLTHPKKATITHEHIDLEEIKKQEAKKLEITGKVRQKQEEQSHIKEAGIRINRELVALESRTKEILENDEEIDELVQTTLGQEIKALEEAIKQINKDQEKMQSYKSKLETLEKEKEALDKNISEYQIKLSQLTTKIEEVQKQLPEDLQDKEALENKLKGIKEEYQSFEKEQAKLVKDFEEIRENRTRLEVVLEGKVLENEKLAKQKLEKKSLFAEQFKSIGFIEDGDYQKAKALAPQIEEIRKGIEAYYTQKTVLESKLIALKEKTKDFDENALMLLKEKYNQLMTLRETHQGTLNKLQDYEQKHKKLMLEMKKLYTKSMVIIKKQHTIGTVATLAKGKNSKGLSFERYIQSSIFEQVLKSANQKLKPMTGSRYELYRAGDRQDRRKQAGLDIAVKDNYVGQTRPVNTLSGGESFMAALALALGLSEVIERLAGAASLDTMFIDEGFGTLDEQALDLAIKTLLSLGDTGRLVGIISHVKELRDQIPARLEIIATNTGSRAEFKI